MSSAYWRKFLIDDHADVKRLDYVIRYSSIPALYQESVSQHSFWVVLHSCGLHRVLSRHMNVEANVQELQILRKALIHDVGECVSGDLVRTFKYSNPDLTKIINVAEDAMVEKYLPEGIKAIITSSESPNEQDHKYEKAVVKAADFVSLFHFMNREHARGNREITPFLNRMVADVHTMSLKANDGTWYGEILSGLYKAMGECVCIIDGDREV